MKKRMKRTLQLLLPVILLLAGCGQQKEEPHLFVRKETAAESPFGMRKFMNYGGFRYEFLENGTPFEPEEPLLAEELDVLEYLIQENPEQYGKLDGACTFAEGGTVFRLEGYDPLFRVAIRSGEEMYLSERVGAVREGVIPAAEYFEKSELLKRTEKTELFDHFERQSLKTLTGKETEKLVRLLSDAEPALLTNEQFEKIARAQNEGKSFRIRFSLEDGTFYGVYVIPELGLCMVGDGRYVLPDSFHSELFRLFSDLPEPLPPIAY